jgi:hypothetical protein
MFLERMLSMEKLLASQLLGSRRLPSASQPVLQQRMIVPLVIVDPDNQAQ